MSSTASNGIRPALVNRQFLHSNATSHEWMFGALAELIDNASDPDVSATQFWIDMLEKNNQPCLEFIDNGNGMNIETLHRMLSFGFSDKTQLHGRLPIGRYGNGFKSGSMRLGKDALVFSKHQTTQSIGMLSQTYLYEINADTVLVPMVTWNADTKAIIYPTTNQNSSLDEILKYSLFHSEKELMDEFRTIPSRKGRSQGSKIIIYNLAKDDRGELELDFNTDLKDIKLSSTNQNFDTTSTNQVSEYKTSLRKYLAILYMKPPMQIFLRKQKVQSIYMKKFLALQKMSMYNPKVFTLPKPIKIRFGINPEQDEHGIMMYNRNRLIQAFRKPSMPKRGTLETDEEYQQVREIWEQTIGVVELDCLTPNHIKQNFQDDSKFRTIETNLASKLWYYCLELLESGKFKTSALEKKEKDLWVQCDEPECQKWRRLPYGTSKELLPDVWKCHMNPDSYYNNCSAPEEPEKDPEIQKTVRLKRPARRNSDNIVAQASIPSSITLVDVIQEDTVMIEEPQSVVQPLDPALENIVMNLQNQKKQALNRKRLSTSTASQKKRNYSTSNTHQSTERQEPELIVIDDEDDDSVNMLECMDTKPSIKEEPVNEEAPVQMNQDESYCKPSTSHHNSFNSSFPSSSILVKCEPISWSLHETSNQPETSSSDISLTNVPIVNGQISQNTKLRTDELQQRIDQMVEEREQLLDELNHERGRADLLEKKVTHLTRLLENANAHLPS